MISRDKEGEGSIFEVVSEGSVKGGKRRPCSRSRKEYDEAERMLDSEAEEMYPIE